MTREEAQKFLETKEAKKWLKKMQYTVKVSETGVKYVFLAILCGYEKIDDEFFNDLCTAVYKANFDDAFMMNMWIGGRVNWTMFFSQPFTHVNGHETFFCHGVGIDDYSPEDWERDMAKIKEKNGGKPVTEKEYIDYLLA